MTGKQSAEFPNMAQRAVMQYLSLDDWKVAARLPIPAGELMLSRIRNSMRGSILVWAGRAAEALRWLEGARRLDSANARATLSSRCGLLFP